MLKRSPDPSLAATMLCASLIMSACGGGGSSSSSNSGGDTSTPKAGLYEATIEYANGARPQAAATFLSPTGTFAVAFERRAGLSFGKLSFDGTRINGISNDYRQLDPNKPNPEGFVEDKGTQEGTINGTIGPQGSITLATSDVSGSVDTNTTLQRQNAFSNLGISLQKVAGTYVSSVTGGPGTALDVGEDGSLFAQYHTSTTGCQLVGVETLSVPDTSINVFDITYTMSNCANISRNGQYSGVGFFSPTADGQMQMVFAAHNGKVAMQFEGTN